MGCTLASLTCAVLLSSEVAPGGWLFLAEPEVDEWYLTPGPPSGVVAFVDDAPVPAYVLHTTLPPGATSGRATPRRWVALRAPEGEEGLHRLTVLAAGEEWEVYYMLRRPALWPGWLASPQALDWTTSSSRPVVDRSFDPAGEDHAGYMTIGFPVTTKGLVVWDRRGALRMIGPDVRVRLTRDPERAFGLNYRNEPHPSPWFDKLPAVIRAIEPDGSLGPAWYIDDDLRLSPEPEVEDGRYELLNPDGSVRWNSDARP